MLLPSLMAFRPSGTFHQSMAGRRCGFVSSSVWCPASPTVLTLRCLSLAPQIFRLPCTKWGACLERVSNWYNIWCTVFIDFMRSAGQQAMMHSPASIGKEQSKWGRGELSRLLMSPTRAAVSPLSSQNTVRSSWAGTPLPISEILGPHVSGLPPDPLNPLWAFTSPSCVTD